MAFLVNITTTIPTITTNFSVVTQEFQIGDNTAAAGGDQNDQGSGNSGNGGNGDSGSSGSDDYNRYWFYSYLPYRIFVTYLLETTLPIAFAAFGIVGNVINLVVFHRQGLLADSCTASLVGLAVSDFCNCLVRFTAIALVAYYAVDFVGQPRYAPPEVRNPATISFFLVKGAVWFTTTTCWITCYIGLERMVSVTFPFHVKRIFTAKRSYFVIVCIFTAGLLLHSHDIFAVKLIPITIFNGDVFFHNVPSGLIGLRFYYVMFTVNFVYLRPICLCLVIAFNTVIIIKVNLSNRFRKSTTTTTATATTTTTTASGINSNNIDNDNDDNKHIITSNNKKESQETSKTATTTHSSNKGAKLTKMMVFLSAMLVFCMSPGIIYMSTLFALSGPLPIPYYGNWILENCMIFFEAVNSSSNLLIYYNMSGRYKKELRQLCRRQKTIR